MTTIREPFILTDIAKAAVEGRETEVLDALGIEWRQGRPHINCPYPDHPDKRPSWRWCTARRRAFCTCIGATDDIFDVVMKLRASDFAEAKLYVAEVIGLASNRGQTRRRASEPSAPTPASTASTTTTATEHRDDRGGGAALDIWRAAQPGAGTKVGTYPRARAITLPVPPSLRFHMNLTYTQTDTGFPAVVAGVQGPDSKIVAVHRTYLLPDGRGKAQVSKPKMALGPIGNGAVRLAKADTELGLAEGVETALSAMQIFDTPCWAVLGSRFDKVWLPDVVRRVELFADSGPAGLSAAHKAVEAFTGQGRKVTLRLPPEGFGDWNDALVALAAETDP